MPDTRFAKVEVCSGVYRAPLMKNGQRCRGTKRRWDLLAGAELFVFTIFRHALFELTEKYAYSQNVLRSSNCKELKTTHGSGCFTKKNKSYNWNILRSLNCGGNRNDISILHNVEILISEFNAKPLILTPYDSSKCRTTSAFSQLAFKFFKQT